MVLLVLDVFLTVFHAQGHGGPLTRGQNRTIWMVFRKVGLRADRVMRAGLLALAAPAMVVATFIAWVVLLVVGFA